MIEHHPTACAPSTTLSSLREASGGPPPPLAWGRKDLTRRGRAAQNRGTEIDRE
jgi:hypothetical protein